MSLVDKQTELEEKLASLRKERDGLTRHIVAARNELDEFLKAHGNVKLRKEREEEWAKKQIEFAERRKDPAWQQWREEFLAKSRQVPSSVKPMIDANVREFELSAFKEGSLMAHVMAEAGIFPSVSQARKNGWDKPIKCGSWVVGKKKIKVVVK